ncbi:sulfate ABC transporter permease subunit CysT [Amaricoccus sp.]|uniref:sulfate ABC transporter permease subunit CysT n=1 Tax=Amaricoccus sp. TaxID=1872485 RepID=UPI001B412B9E|nr:sulfate ABC transporter permease subunit CysT [Amaricoccus sp.]MBP7000227.1 sulfate ABC transporter permease subunit CysT [Amaricoccus sp.]
MRGVAFRASSPLPGFGISFGITAAMLSCVVLLPIGALLFRGALVGPVGLWETINRPRVWSALELSFMTSLYAALFNLVFGLAVAWTLTRYRFWGRKLIDATVDLPFALPTAVAGIALTTLYAPNGVFGAALAPLGIQVAYTRLGIFVALVFVGLPFVVRTVQPVIEELEREVEEASATLGASRARTFVRVVLPTLAPALLTGGALAFARSVGEYGSVIFIAGNLPNVTEIAPLLIVIRLEEFDYDGAVAIAIAMLAISFAMLLAINLIQVWSRRRFADA